MTDSLLPPSASDKDRAIAAACARIGELPSPLRALWDPETCPEPLLPWLAWSLGVEEWDEAWPAATKRLLCRFAIATRRIRGTRKAVEDSVIAYGARLSLREWWELSPPGDPHTFSVVIDYGTGSGTATEKLQADVIRAIERNKPLRSHYSLTVAIPVAGAVNVVGFARPGVFARLQLTG